MDLEQAPGDFDEGVLGDEGSLGLLLVLSWEEPELESLLCKGAGLDLSLLFLPLLSSLLPLPPLLVLAELCEG